MNKLSLQTRVQILSMLVEGSSMRSISRVCGVSINTVTKLLVDAGTACATFHDEKVRNVKPRRVQCDEIWAFCYAKAKHVPTAKTAPAGAGDLWTWTGICTESKMIVSWLVGAAIAATQSSSWTTCGHVLPIACSSPRMATSLIWRQLKVPSGAISTTPSL